MGRPASASDPNWNPNSPWADTLLHWPCPNKTSSYPKKPEKRARARHSVSAPTQLTLPLPLSLALSFYFPLFAYLSLSVFRSQCEGEPRAWDQHWAVPRTHQTLPWLIRLAWHDAFFPFLLYAPPSFFLPLRLSFLFNKCQEKVFFRHSPAPVPSPAHCHCRSRSSLLNLKRCCGKEWEISWGSGRRRATCQAKAEERDPARATAPAPALAPAPAATLAIATATATAPATHLKRVTSQELQQWRKRRRRRRRRMKHEVSGACKEMGN